MRRGIGSIFEISKEDYCKDNEFNIELLKKYYGEVADNYEFVSSGREAIAYVLKHIQNNQSHFNKVCLLPMYTCDTVILPFLHDGWEILYYPVHRNLFTNVSAFEEILEQHKPSVIFIHNYYGVDTNTEIRTLLEDQQRQGVIVIEDTTQDFAKSAFDFCADYYIASLRKWFHITDGAFIASKYQLKKIQKKERTQFVDLKWEALTQKKFYLDILNEKNYDDMQKIKQMFLKNNADAENLLYEETGIFAMSKLSKSLLKGIDIETSLTKRAENAKSIYDSLYEFPGIELPLKYTGESVPLYVPIYVERREKIQEFMRRHDIFIPILWPIPQQILITDKETKKIYMDLLALPCDGRYDTDDMKYMCDVLKRGLE